MTLTNETLARFVGGQMEIQNPGEDYLYRGEIETIVIEDRKLRVHFKWLGKNNGGPNRPSPEWTSHTDLDYTIDLMICGVTDIGTGTEGGNRIAVNCGIVGELSVLYPPDGSRLDPARVKGLEAA